MLPSTGAGAVNAMQDAVILANCLYDIKPTSFESIKEALKEYRDQRFDCIEQQYTQSHIYAKLQYGHVSTLFQPQGVFERKEDENEIMQDEGVRSLRFLFFVLFFTLLHIESLGAITSPCPSQLVAKVDA